MQITGGSYPARRQAASIRGRNTALAICAQFQVTRYSTPFTAATATCNASVAARCGSGTSRIICLRVPLLRAKTQVSALHRVLPVVPQPLQNRQHRILRSLAKKPSIRTRIDSPTSPASSAVAQREPGFDSAKPRGNSVPSFRCRRSVSYGYCNSTPLPFACNVWQLAIQYIENHLHDGNCTKGESQTNCVWDLDFPRTVVRGL